ncbi:hypothetical protein GF337_03420 [candidate division KSB1 bacterium]|nr:hypothetical protein [candidate division KSB1 bacterium]
MNQPEITWSLMHPTPLDVDYFNKVIKASTKYHVDSFEICGECHTTYGGIDGLIFFKDYPAVRQHVDSTIIKSNQEKLNSIIRAAHNIGRPVYLWHREIMLPEAMPEFAPELFDENLELDLFGNAFRIFLKNKLTEFFESIPNLDGLVLTLTEADFSVIHHSDSDRYPPVKVVEYIVRIFAEFLNIHNKQFILRSFGSIDRDYEDILAGAELAAKDFHFEIETKITAFDFNPFFPVNPYLKHVPGTTLSAECDSLGEFMGAGQLPAANVDNIVTYVKAGYERKIERFAIRVDRVGNSIINSAYEINLFAYDQAIKNPKVNPEEIYSIWAEQHCPDCERELINILKFGFEYVTKMLYIDGQLIFHTNPVSPMIKWLKAGGIPAVFQENVSLENHRHIWSIFDEKQSPTHEKILREKDQAIELALAVLKKLDFTKNKMNPDFYKKLRQLWENALKVGVAIRALCECLCAYVTDMRQRKPNFPELTHAIKNAQMSIQPIIDRKQKIKAHENSESVSDAIEHDIFKVTSIEVNTVYLIQILHLIETLGDEYIAEFKESAHWTKRKDIVDYIVCGGIADDYRVSRYMHASHGFLKNSRVYRQVGNRMFPNGYIECALKTRSTGKYKLIVSGDPNASEGFSILINDHSINAEYSADGFWEQAMDLPSDAQRVTVRISKRGKTFPQIYSIAIVKI